MNEILDIQSSKNFLLDNIRKSKNSPTNINKKDSPKQKN